MRLHPDKARALDLIDRTSEVINSRPKGVLEMPTPYAFATGMYFVRSRPLFRGIAVLIQNDLVSEAMILCRPLFTESLRLGLLASMSEDRLALLLGWANESIGEKIGLIKEAAAHGIEYDPELALQALENERNRLLGYQKRHKISRLRRIPSERQMATLLAREEDLWTYSYLSEHVHGSEISHSSRRRKASDETTQFFDSHVDHEESHAVAAFAAKSVLIAHDSFSKIVGWPRNPDVQPLLDEINGVLYPNDDEDSSLHSPL